MTNDCIFLFCLQDMCTGLVVVLNHLSHLHPILNIVNVHFLDSLWLFEVDLGIFRAHAHIRYLISSRNFNISLNWISSKIRKS